MADALSEHLRRYNTAFGAQLDAGRPARAPHGGRVPPEHRAAAEAMLDATSSRTSP